MPETPAAFPVEKLPHGFQCLVSRVSVSILQAVVDISVKQSKRTAKGLSWFWFVPPQLRQSGHRWGEEEGIVEMWVVVLKH